MNQEQRNFLLFLLLPAGLVGGLYLVSALWGDTGVAATIAVAIVGAICTIYVGLGRDA